MVMGSWYYEIQFVSYDNGTFIKMSSTKFQIIHESGSNVKPEEVSLTEQVLIIPPCVLDYGKHLFHLEVYVMHFTVRTLELM